MTGPGRCHKRRAQLLLTSGAYRDRHVSQPRSRRPLDASHVTVMESDRTFPSEAQASAAALAFSKLVTRAGKTLSAPTLGGLL